MISIALCCLWSNEVPGKQEDLLGGQECSAGASSLEELHKAGQGIGARALHCLWHPWQGREGEKLCAKPPGWFWGRAPTCCPVWSPALRLLVPEGLAWSAQCFPPVTTSALSFPAWKERKLWDNSFAGTSVLLSKTDIWKSPGYG